MAGILISKVFKYGHSQVSMLVAMEEIDLVRVSEMLVNVDISHVPAMLKDLDYTAHSLHEIINARHQQTAYAGRSAPHVKSPSLVRVATDHGFAAQERRRDTTCTGSVHVPLRQSKGKSLVKNKRIGEERVIT